jgi:hypothetical protein
MIILFSTIHIKKRIQIYKLYEISYVFARHFSGRYFEKSMIESSWAVILFRNVEHCGISSVNGTSSIRFPEFRPDEISLIPRNSSQFRNSVQFLKLQLIPDPNNSRNSVQAEPHAIPESNGIGRNSQEFRPIPLWLNGKSYFDRKKKYRMIKMSKESTIKISKHRNVER